MIDTNRVNGHYNSHARPRNRDALRSALHSIAYGIIARLHRADCPDEILVTFVNDHRFAVRIVVGPSGAVASPDTIRLAVEGPRTIPILPSPQRGEGRPATVNQRMLAMLEADPEKSEWTCKRWANAFGCTPGAVHATPAWRRIMTMRAFNRSERLNGRR
jgi:hypothetical protein